VKCEGGVIVELVRERRGDAWLYQMISVNLSEKYRSSSIESVRTNMNPTEKLQCVERRIRRFQRAAFQRHTAELPNYDTREGSRLWIWPY
jgi:hypothetical protein